MKDNDTELQCRVIVPLSPGLALVASIVLSPVVLGLDVVSSSPLPSPPSPAPSPSAVHIWYCCHVDDRILKQFQTVPRNGLELLSPLKT